MTSKDTQLGRLENVGLRDIWKNEAANFTPWLAQEQNIKLLSDTIGMELEVQGSEQSVGPFSADILCKDTSQPDHLVLIENQLEKTDHRHLGQLLTYAAGLKTVSVVWIASCFTDEHRAALDWLNDMSHEGFRFFGLEIEVWKIGDSAAAPKFNMVASPNNWIKSVTGNTGKGDLSPAKALQLEFWAAFKAYADDLETLFKLTKPQADNYIDMSIGRSGFTLVAVASTWDSLSESWDVDELRPTVWIGGSDAQRHYQALESVKDEIEKELGEPLAWHNPPNTLSAKVYVRRDADLKDRTKWPEYFDWQIGKLDKLYTVFSPRIKNLD